MEIIRTVEGYAYLAQKGTAGTRFASKRTLYSEQTYQSHPAHVSRPRSQEGQRSLMTKKKVLVVEDNLDTRELIHLHLTTEGFTVVTASNGQEGLYSASAEQPDLIITDISMPELDGLELVRQLRTQPEFATLPVLVLTAFGREQLDEAIAAGASRALNKPVLLDGLIEDVRDLLAESQRK